jgi:type IV pilus assembly protein PilQ
MTRKFLSFTFSLFLIFFTGCSLLDSDSKAPVSEIEGELAEFEDGLGEEEAELDSSDEDFDVETAVADSSSTDTKTKEDSFSDIEDFNEDLIEGELSNEETNLAALEEIPKDEEEDFEDLDLESAVAPEEATPAPVVAVEPTPSPAPQPESTFVTATNNITNLEYKSQQSGGSVVITAERPFEYQIREEPQFNQTIIEALDVNLSARFKQPYIAKDFGQAVATINSYQEKGSNVATFVIQYKEQIKPNVAMAGNTLVIQSVGVVAKNATAQPTYVANADVSPSQSFSTSELDASADGKRINIQLDDILVSDLIKIIADEIGFNVIVDEDVTGKVNNVKLIDVPWKEALSSILGAQGLSYERKGQIVRVATVTKLTKELNATKERLEAELGARTAASTQTIKVVPVSYADIAALVTQIQPVLTPSKGKVTPDMRSSSVVIYDMEDNVKRAEQIIRSLDVKPVQVLVEGRIIEAKSDFLKQFGINWSTAASPGSTIATGTVNGNIVPGTTLPGGALGNIIFGTVGVLDNLQATLAVYEQEEKIKVLSAPRVVTLNKEKAMIKQTEQVPLTQTIIIPNAPTQIMTTFRDVILQIEVTPQVTFNADMILDISVRRDIAGGEVNGSRAINTREAQAKVLVKDGHSVVMGGILSMDDVLNEAGVPWLKDIPILGYLFKSKRRQVVKNELVIFLQPKILNNESLSKDMEMTDLGSSAPPLDPPPADESSKEFDAEDLDSEIETL